jgi:DNA helicase-2/ATP-dependent DNA helicase PcrA
MALWMADKSADAPGRLENLMELVNAAAEFDNLASFLEHVALFMELNEVEDQNMVNIMTLHSAKGMEFDTVFLAGWEEGLLPHEKALKEHGMRALEEERRLAHVGLTRARQRVVLSFATRRRWYGHWVQGLPSRFVDELPKEHVEMESDPGVYVAPGASSELDLGGGRVGPVLDDPVDLVEDVPPTTFAEGMCVFHKLFHYGTVAAVDGDRLDIDFDEAGKKRVLARFVVLED